jgi:hypothetical protein
MEREKSLEPDDLRSRLSFDYQVAKRMHNPMMTVEAYRNIDDLLARHNPIVSEDESHLATHYRVDYYIKTLIGPGRYSNKTTVRFDLFIDNNYPFSQPGCFVIDSPMPWSPHFYLAAYPICIGKIWEQGNGSMLLGELMVHVARLLNFDEPKYADADYVGYSREAIKYWETELDRQPITRNLVYPRLPDLVHAVAESKQQPTRAFVRKKVTEPAASVIRLRPTSQINTGSPRIRIKPSGNSQE